MRTLVVLLCILMAALAGCATTPPGPAGPPPVTTPTSAPSTTTAPAGTSAPAPSTAPSPAPTSTPPAPHGRAYPWHTGIVSTTFWVGELFDKTLADGSQVCSTYDAQWAYHWSGGVNAGKVPAKAAGCGGSIVGGCDGVPSVDKDGVPTGAKCDTEIRTADNGWFPRSPHVHPAENPFYLDLPFDDLNDPVAFKQRCKVVPWAGDPGYTGRCSDGKFSLMKNRWVHLTGPSGRDCYGQIEDAGPSSGKLYHDTAYVFGTNDARPTNRKFNGAGADVSPALNGCLGFAELNGENDRVRWQFVDDVDVPAGPWTRIVTTSGVTE